MADRQTTHRPEVLKAEQSNSLNFSKSTKKENSGDRQIDIALGKHRNDKTWKNKSIEWSAFVERCSNTHWTAETIAAYMAAPKSRQDEIKDVGAFVGGYLAGGRRKKDSITHRQLITLDADFATPGIWDEFTMLFGCAAVIYSTHKHTPEKPRIRLIIPLDRTVNSDEYEAISRKIAGEIGIEQFDHTTFQANRLMYWPSTSKDGVFWFEEQQGEFLSADEILGKYTDWTDTSEWPTSEKENAAIKTGIKKQGDPTEKPGLIGVFCRLYGIHETIEKFLSEVYEPCDMEDRFTFIGGSTSGGLIVYEDKFAFSHHGTDPTSGKLCNAFDLVRIHLFGLRDEDKDSDTPVNKLPSYLAMQEFAGKDEAVKQLLLKEKMNSAREDFADDSDEERNVEWAKKLDIDRKGNVLSSYDNLEVILRFDPLLKGKIGYDEFSNVKVIKGKVPWDRPDNSNEWGDIDEAGLRSYMGGKPYEIKSKGMIEDCLIKIAYENRFHSIRDYLEGLTWDGVQRLDTLFIDYLGAEETPLNRILTRKTLVAAVARIYRPGCKFDYVLTLISDEGAKKSTLLYNLGRGKWFSDSLNFGMISGGNGKQAFEQIQNRWIIEIAEMAGLKKAEVEAVKGFITSREDYYRASHSAHMSSRPRQCIFIGTSNNMDFLVSQTGSRRFWPMPIKVIRPTKQVQEVMPDEEIGQLWAEAVVRYHEGETLYLTPELEDQMRLIQQQHTEVDPRESRIQWYLDSLVPENWVRMSIYERRSFLSTQNDPDDIQPKGTQLREKVSVAEIWTEAFDGHPKDMTSANTKFIQNYMRRKAKDWEQKFLWMEGKSVRGYARKQSVTSLFNN